MRARCKAAPGAYFLSSQCRDQFQKAVDNGLVKQVDEQGLAAAPAEKAGDGRLLKRAGKKRPFFAVGRFADGRAN